MYSEANSNQFLAMYNQIDKYFDQLLQLKRYLPFFEKIRTIGDGQYHISHFVRKYEAKFRYFSDLRNQIAHGFRLENKHYVIASDHAVQEITKFNAELQKPKT